MGDTPMTSVLTLSVALLPGRSFWYVRSMDVSSAAFTPLDLAAREHEGASRAGGLLGDGTEPAGELGGVRDVGVGAARGLCDARQLALWPAR